jgi:hypothetical protein
MILVNLLNNPGSPDNPVNHQIIFLGTFSLTTLYYYSVKTPKKNNVFPDGTFQMS